MRPTHRFLDAEGAPEEPSEATCRPFPDPRFLLGNPAAYGPAVVRPGMGPLGPNKLSACFHENLRFSSGPQILTFSTFAPRLGASIDIQENATFMRRGKTGTSPPAGGVVSFEGGTNIASERLRKFASILDAGLLRFGIPKSFQIEPKSLPTRSGSQLGIGSRFRIRLDTILVAKMAQISII